MLRTALALLRSQGLRVPCIPLPLASLPRPHFSLWDAREFLFPAPPPALTGLGSCAPVLALGDIGSSSDSSSLSSSSSALSALLESFTILAMNRNKRECVTAPGQSSLAWLLPFACAAPKPPHLAHCCPLHPLAQTQEGKPWRPSLQQRAPQAQVRHAGQPAPLHSHLKAAAQEGLRLLSGLAGTRLERGWVN